MNNGWDFCHNEKADFYGVNKRSFIIMQFYSWIYEHFSLNLLLYNDLWSFLQNKYFNRKLSSHYRSSFLAFPVFGQDIEPYSK